MNPTESERQKLVQVEEIISRNIEEVIQIEGYQDEIEFVETQGSYAKGTDLSGNSDLDIFVVFNKNVPRDKFEKIGLDIGKKALKDYKPYTRYAEHPFTEAFVGDVEIQIVPAYDISLEDVKSGNLLSATDRTPHQTRFMNENLTNEQKEDVRKLKQFMKDNGVYGSDERIKGFSGYSAEVLVYERGSFDDVIDFFVKFKTGRIIGKPAQKFETIFVIIDPIDPNRNLVSAFSNQKIARMIKVCEHLQKTGRKAIITTTKVDSIGVSIPYEDRSDDKLFGEINRSVKSIIYRLGKLGYKTKRGHEQMTKDWISSIPRTSFNIDKENKKITMYFGLENFENNDLVKIKGPPLDIEIGVKKFREANPDSEIIEEDGRLVRYEERENKTAQDALTSILSKGLYQSGISGGIIKDIKKYGFSIENKKEREFENIV